MKLTSIMQWNIQGEHSVVYTNLCMDEHVLKVHIAVSMHEICLHKREILPIERIECNYMCFNVSVIAIFVGG